MSSSKKTQLSPTIKNLMDGIIIIKKHPLFGSLCLNYYLVSQEVLGKEGAARVDSGFRIYLNKQRLLSPSQWAYVIAHCQLHHSFGHFDAKTMPGYQDASGVWKPVIEKALWNTACDLYIAKFLTDIKFGTPLWRHTSPLFPANLSSEQHIYHYLLEHEKEKAFPYCGTASPDAMDMDGLTKPLRYSDGQSNPHIKRFAWALAHSVSHTVSEAGGCSAEKQKAKTENTLAAEWFISHYPLLGALASAFHIIEDGELCRKYDIQIAAIDMELGEIYINPSIPLSIEERRFVLAHEYLHAGLGHQNRCQGRDPYLWNIACDYVINTWLLQIHIGNMPEGLLYDESLKELSAESIYDLLIKDLKKYSRLQNLRGYGKGEFLNPPKSNSSKDGVTLDEFCRNALAQGLEFTLQSGRSRGLIPAGLIEEIRALSMPPIPWDVKLARWFNTYFPSIEKQRTYARPSRRQGSTPDIPRPRYIRPNLPQDSRTFGVILDTSCSMSTKEIGKALGSIASYAAARDVLAARVIFCDAAPYDAGYLTPEDIAGKVRIQGRGGTRLQPAIDLLAHAPDFPKDGPILLITDGLIEPSLHIRRPHAFLLPKGCNLPFRTREIFYFS